MKQDEWKLVERVGEETYERGKLIGSIELLALRYEYDEDVPDRVVEELRELIND